jgi:hypothetical protein
MRSSNTPTYPQQPVKQNDAPGSTYQPQSQYIAPQQQAPTYPPQSQYGAPQQPTTYPQPSQYGSMIPSTPPTYPQQSQYGAPQQRPPTYPQQPQYGAPQQSTTFPQQLRVDNYNQTGLPPVPSRPTAPPMNPSYMQGTQYPQTGRTLPPVPSNAYPSAPPMEQPLGYEVPPQMRDAHEMEFYEHSANLEDSLRQLQLVLIVDRSGSMNTPDEDGTGQHRQTGMTVNGTWTRWDNTFQAAKYLAESVLEYDKDGNIPLLFFGNGVEEINVRSVGEMLLNFKRRLPTNESTNLLAALQTAFQRNVNNTENVLFIIFTDGAPIQGQQPHVKQLIRDQITRNDPTGTRLNLLFIRMGDDPQAMEFLADLDDSPDIAKNIDTKSDNAMYMMGPKNLILNAIHEHLDHIYQNIN